MSSQRASTGRSAERARGGVAAARRERRADRCPGRPTQRGLGSRRGRARGRPGGRCSTTLAQTSRLIQGRLAHVGKPQATGPAPAAASIRDRPAGIEAAGQPPTAASLQVASRRCPARQRTPPKGVSPCLRSRTVPGEPGRLSLTMFAALITQQPAVCPAQRCRRGVGRWRRGMAGHHAHSNHQVAPWPAACGAGRLRLGDSGPGYH